MKTGTAKDSLVDFSGEHSGGAFTKRMIAAIVGTVVLYFLFSCIDMSAYGANCSKAVGFVAAVIYWMVVSPLEMTVAAFMIMTAGVFLGIFTISDVQSRLGSSALYSLLGMMMVAGGISQTVFGERLSYWVLYKFGQKPVRMLMLVGLVAIVLSAFVSNIATIILLSSICNSLLLAMGEKPGQSRIGKAMMSIIPMGAMFGGCALITGAPTGALNGIAYMNAASGDLNLTVTYANWAKIAVPSVLICMVPMVMIYIWCFKIKNRDFACPPPEYFKKHLDEMGKIGGSEIRWLIIVFAMVVTMISGMNTAVSAILFACISILPGIGVANCKDSLKSVPWGILMCVCLCPLIGTAITNNGVADLLGDLIRPLFGNIGPLAFSILTTTLLFLAMNLMVNATHGAQAMVISLCVPICISLGYNPATCMLPTLLGGGWFWAIGANYIVMMNKGYGWWEIKDPILPGFLCGAFVCIVIPVINYILTPLWGLSLYL